MSQGCLYLIPTVISENQTDVIPDQVRNVIRNTDYFLAENLRTARRYISSLNLGLTIEELQFEVLDKKTTQVQVEQMMAPIFKGKNIGLMSESGCPGVADPGSVAVQYAHSKLVRVVPLVGPSSIFLVLMASGFNGQQFAFHGYLPIDKRQLEKKINVLEEESRRKNQTQIFIEAPYRNNQLLQMLLKHAHPNTMLCVARDVSGSQEMIRSLSIKEWRKTTIDLHKIPTVFTLLA